MSNKYIIFLGVLVVLFVGGVGVFLTSNKTATVEKQTNVAPTQIPQAVENTVTSSQKKAYTLADVSQHSTESDCWIVVENNVYDMTPFIPDHPGGREIIEGCGRDATSMFQREREHQKENAASYLPPYQIGVLQ